MYQAQQLLRSKIRKSVLIDDDEPMHTEQATGYRSGGHDHFVSVKEMKGLVSAPSIPSLCK